MQDMLTQLEKLRRDAAECELIRDLATDFKKRELFDRLATHFSVLATEVEKGDPRERQERIIAVRRFSVSHPIKASADWHLGHGHQDSDI